MEKDEEEKIKRSIKLTLNKLSPGNFDRLKVQLLEQAKQSEAILLLLSRGIFDKACSEVKFTELYAALCQFISREYGQFKQISEGIDPARYKDVSARQPFKKNVLYVCQEVFEADPSEHVFTGMTEEEATAKKALIKKRTLGNVRFIGELFKVAFISARTVLNCVYDMTHPMMKEEQDFREIDLDEVNEDKLEGAVILLKTGGSKFSEPKLKEKTDYIMRFLEHIISSERLSQRVKFLLMVRTRQNIVDTYRQGWPQKTSH
jgi:translation initiation factor 4G